MINQKTVLVTGATGLLGRQILQQLKLRNYKIYAVRRPDSIIPSESEKICWIEIQSTTDNIFDQVPVEIDYLIHAGAMVSYKKSDKGRIFQINTDWSGRLAQDALKEQVEKFIFISSVAALGKNTKNNFIDENTPASRDEFRTNYGESKRQAEKLLWKVSEQGLPIIIFNPSVIIGPAKRYQSSAQLFAYVSDGKPFFTRGLINYVDVRDVAEHVVASLESKTVNEQFILNGGSISYRDFFKVIAKQLKVNAPKLGVPKFMVILGAFLENIISKLKGKPATLTMETARMAGNKNIYSAEKAEKAFGLKRRSLEHSVEWTVVEMQKTNEL